MLVEAMTDEIKKSLSAPSFKTITCPIELEKTLSPYLKDLMSYIADPDWHSSINKELYHIVFSAKPLAETVPAVYHRLLQVVTSALELHWPSILKQQTLLSSSALLLESIQQQSRHPLVQNKKLSVVPIKKSLETLFKIIAEKFDDLASDKYGSILVRHSLKLMAGVLVPPFEKQAETPKKSITRRTEVVEIPPFDDQITERLMSLCTQHLLSPNSRKLMENDASSPCLQLLLVVVATRLPIQFEDICKKLLKKKYHLWLVKGDTVNYDGDKKVLPASLQHQVCSHFVEQLVCLLPEALLEKLIRRQISGRELHLCKDGQAAYTLQQVILSIPPSNVSLLTRLMNATLPHFLNFSLNSVHSVLQAFAKAALSCKPIQGLYLKNIETLFQCDEDASRLQLFPAVLCLQRYKVDEANWGNTPHVAGALILQSLLQFKHPQSLAQSFMHLSTEPNMLQLWCCHATTSHVMEALVKNKCLNLEQKMQFAERLQPMSVDFACDKYGSHLLEAFWDVNHVPIRENLARALGKKADMLKTHPYGGFVFRKFALGHYARSVAEWRARYVNVGCATQTPVHAQQNKKGNTKVTPLPQGILTPAVKAKTWPKHQKHGQPNAQSEFRGPKKWRGKNGFPASSTGQESEPPAKKRK